MSNWKKIAIGTGVGGIIIGGIIFIPKLIKLAGASPELDVIPTAQIHKVDLTGITIRLDVQLKNPTTAAFKMKYPYVRITYKGTTIGTSQSVNEDIGMPGFGEANINQIMIHVPMMSLLSLSGTLLKAVQNNEEVGVDVTTVTHIDPYWKYDETKKEWKKLISLGKSTLIPYSKTQSVTLRKQK